MNTKPESGVTLIEILIAVSLLSLLSVGMLVAMRLGFTTMDKTDAKLIANRRVANSRQIIEDEINGFVYSMALFHPKPGDGYPVVFLQTEPQSMRFVTAYSINDGWRGRPQIAAMQVIAGERNQGVRLILNETPYTGQEQAGQEISGIEQSLDGPPIIHYRSVEAGTQSFVLADRLAYCRFSYLEPLFEPPFQRWRTNWIAPLRLPQAVRIEMAPLDAKAGDLHVSTVTVPFLITRPPGTYYADFTPKREEEQPQ